MHHVAAYGPPGLADKARTMFEPADEGGINFVGICPGGVCLTLPRDEICFGTYRLTLRPASGRHLEVCGFGSASFMPEFLLFNQGEGSLIIAGKKMKHPSERNKRNLEKYQLEVEFIPSS